MNSVIKIDNLYKEYRLGVINHGTLTHDLQSMWARIRGKDDPNSLISDNHRENVEAESFLALKDITFDVNQGDRLGIIGQNGAGKSTLLKILSKITAPTKGNIKIKGRIASLLEVGTGFHPELTGRENIYLNGSILGMRKREIDKKLDEIVSFAGVEQHIDTPVKRYSSGMNVRLGFAVAAHLEPEILIVDEVLAVGDANFQKRAIGKMDEVSKKDGRTILFVSHNMDSIMKLCDRAVCLHKGNVVYDGGVAEGIRNYLQKTGAQSEMEYKETLTYDEKINGYNLIDIESYRICEESGEPSSYLISTGKKYKLEIDLDLIVPDQDIRLGFGIYDSNDKLVFNTSCVDYKNLYFSKLDKGKHKLVIDFPVDMLYQGDYYVELLLMVERKGWILHENNATRMKFKAIFSGIDMGIPNDRLGGYHSTVKRKLEWSVS